jgi:recombination associated protein RdgC
MFFKNATVYELEESIEVESLIKGLQSHIYTPCMSHQEKSQGFIHPLLRNHEECYHRINQFLFFAIQIEEKIIPTQVVNNKAEEKVDDIERLQKIKIGKHEKKSIKEETYQSLVPQAFSKCQKTYAYIDLAHKYLVIDSVSPKSIESLTILLRKGLGSLKIKPIFEDISKTLTYWFKDEGLPKAFMIEDRCKLMADQGDGVAIINCQGNSMLSNNIMSFIEGGGLISELSLSWKDQVKFSLTDQFQIKSLKFLESISSLNSDISKEDPVIKSEADMILMGETLYDLIESLRISCTDEPQEDMFKEDDIMVNESI